MSATYELLETLQEDVIAILKATPTLEAANIIAEQNGDLDSEVERILGLNKLGNGGKRGLAVIVFLPEVVSAEPNLPGPCFVVKQEIQIVEHPKINRAPTGTGLRSSHAAMLSLKALHHQILGAHSLYAGEKPVTPLPARDGLISHLVSVFCYANGLDGPDKPLAVTAVMSEGENPALTLACGTSGAEIRYTTDGSYPSPTATLYATPLTGLEAGTVLRAAAYKAGLNPGDCTEVLIS